MAELKPDAEMLRAFLNAAFAYADPETYVSLRIFNDARDDRTPVDIEAIRIDREDFVQRVVACAAKAANGGFPGCFAPPVCTFRDNNGAKTEDLAQGLVLTVECDRAPKAARAKLTPILGKPTAVVRSGGEWLNPQSGNTEPKEHLHWRLATPTRTPDEHAKLREARELACKLVGGDTTCIAIVHPLRWPGSWHRKNPDRPRIAHLVDDNGVDHEHEIELNDALAKLRAACPQAERNAHRPNNRAEEVPLEDVEAALEVIPNPDLSYPDWCKIGMAVWSASGGKAFAAFDKWSAKSPKKYGGTQKAWDAWTRSPPTKLTFRYDHRGASR